MTGRIPAFRSVALAAACFGIAFALLFARAMVMSINHDEQQFVASGALLAAHSLLPYRDYPYFHTPVQVVVDAFLFKHATGLFFTARLFSVFLAWAALWAIFWIAYLEFAPQPGNRRLLLALGVSALLLVNETFAYTYFRAWNHSLPILLMLLSIGCHSLGARRGRMLWFFASGGCLALAIGTRLSFAPLALPFLIMAWLVPKSGAGTRVKFVVAFGAGMIVGFAPAAIIIAQAPGAFFFDNFVYNGPINAAYRGGRGTLGSAVWGKIRFFAEFLIQPSNLTLLAAFVYLNARWPHSYLRRLVLVVLPFAMMGTLSATPSYTQYYYPVVTLCVIGVLAALSEMQSNLPAFRRAIVAVVVALGVGGVTAAIDYHYLICLGDPQSWATERARAEGLAIRKMVPSGYALTLAPIVALEAGLDIYPSLATGPFAWRTADILSPIQRASYKFAGPKQLANLVAPNPPSAVLTGIEKKLEGPLVDYAKEHGYRKVKLSDQRTLWVRPEGSLPHPNAR